MTQVYFRGFAYDPSVIRSAPSVGRKSEPSGDLSARVSLNVGPPTNFGVALAAIDDGVFLIPVEAELVAPARGARQIDRD